MDKKRKLDILKDAMEIELNGIELYKTAAEKTEDEQAKEMFHFLADEEVKHFNALKQMYEETNNGKKVIINLPTEGKPKFGEIFSKKFKENLKGKNYEYSVLKTGLLLEQNSQEFYRKQKESAETPEEKELFKKLESWEGTHYKMLLKEYNDMKISFWESNNFQPF
jgi:rubrerythrin